MKLKVNLSLVKNSFMKSCSVYLQTSFIKLRNEKLKITLGWQKCKTLNREPMRGLRNIHQAWKGFGFLQMVNLRRGFSENLLIGCIDKNC
jgi:hypothetical protein